MKTIAAMLRNTLFMVFGYKKMCSSVSRKTLRYLSQSGVILEIENWDQLFKTINIIS